MAESSNKFCIQCGTGLPAAARFCPSCGQRIGATTPSKLSRSVVKHAVIAGLLGALIWGVGWLGQARLSGPAPTGHAPTKIAQLPPQLLELKRAADSQPENLHLQRLLASQLVQIIRENDPPTQAVVFEAIEVLSRILRATPEDRDALIALADITFTQQVFVKAVEYYERYLKLEPEDLNARTRYASALAFTNKFEAAIGELEGVLKVDPKNFHAAAYLAIVYAQWGNEAKALSSGEKALELAPNEEARARFSGFLKAVRNGEVGGTASQKKLVQNSAASSLAPEATDDRLLDSINEKIKANPIAGPKYRGASRQGRSKIVLKFDAFPMREMPDHIRTRFVASVVDIVRSSEIESLDFIDASNSTVLHSERINRQ